MDAVIEKMYDRIFSSTAAMPEDDWESWYVHKIHSKRAFLGTDGVKNERYYGLIVESIRRVTRMCFDGSHVIEIGSGSGLASVFLAMRGANATLVDNAAMALEYARLNIASLKRGGCALAPVSCVQSDLFSLPDRMSGGSFDLVQSYGLIEHFSDEDILRILDIKKHLAKKGGWILSGVPNFFSPIMMYKWSNGKGNERYLKKARLISLMKKAGLRDIRVVFLPYVFTEFAPLFMIRALSTVEEVLGRIGLGSMYLCFARK
ncbi:methyltransferase domain-containing protein [Candidatus Woesearchaeota archaeon]|nr:methyltransferase domain-containing protein [Candidatus Woesearchaeota archaeon]